ncbi:hypothetical protein NHX12_004465 [Muraenolepis orangiensis]|uniref:Uncharacterized protein n=1 Tax=Muraenolepis orangiensis TaxID=630683 RepID=A0A9Q0DV97_9TELE|nr:hypothetical protein NHX12_004465 [Muraenolepis orangiensis]
MAARCTNLARSALLKGVRLLSGPSPRTPGHPTGVACLRAAQCRPLHLTPGPALAGTRTGQQQQVTTDKPSDKNTREEEEMYDGPEYIPQRQAKNPMRKMGYAWVIGLPCGVLAFVLVKREVDKNRLKQLRVRQRMNRSNDGDYEGGRYRRLSDQGLEVDR